jgi:hypothetical protein
MSVIIRTTDNMYVSEVCFRTGNIDYDIEEEIPEHGEPFYDVISGVVLARDHARIFKNAEFAKKVMDESVPGGMLLKIENT